MKDKECKIHLNHTYKCEQDNCEGCQYRIVPKMTRKEMSKIICKHLRKDSLVDGVDETYLISSVMDALKEITSTTDSNTPETEIRNATIDEFVDKAWEVLGSSDNDIYARESIAEIAELMKSGGNV
jgi:hypothetical protein